MTLFKRRAANERVAAPVTRTTGGIDPDNLPLRLVGWGRPNSRRRKKDERYFREAWERTGQLLGERPEAGTNEGTDRQPSQGMPTDQAAESDDAAEGDDASAEAKSIRAVAIAEAERLVTGARAEAEDIRAEARAERERIRRFLADAVTEAGRMRADARAEAERIKDVVIALADYARIAASQEKVARRAAASDQIVISAEGQAGTEPELRYLRMANRLSQELATLASGESVTDEMLFAFLDSWRSEEPAAVEERKQEPAGPPQK